MTDEIRVSVRRAYEVCPVEVSIAVLGGAWKLSIVKSLMDGPVRFGALGRSVGAVTPRVLTRQLRELEEDGIVSRMVYAESPPRVEYALTDHGLSLRNIVLAINDWGKFYTEQVVFPKITGRNQSQPIPT